MAKILVLDAEKGTPVPFLRGILTRSLQDAGLSFEDAYEVSSVIRQGLGDSSEATVELTSVQLRDRVREHLKRVHGEDLARRYQAATTQPPELILVRHADDHTTPFSRSQHRHCLESCGLSTEESTAITFRLYQDLLKKGVTEISSRRLRGLTYRYLERDLGPEVARRHLVWTDFLASDRPLLLIIGGTAGCGKSTVATEVAHRLEIVRAQSTDMLREVMRMMIPKRLLPVLHSSSFNAWQSLPAPEQPAEDPDAALIDGYRTQAQLVAVACEAVVQRALKERVSLILEGVHMHPSFLERIPQTDAIVVSVMLGVLKPEQLRQRIAGRGKETPQRRAKRYLTNFEAIWRLQSFLLSEADRAQVPIIPNEDKDRAIQQVMATVIDALGRNFAGSAEGIEALQE